ncbi:MAG: TIGR00266 family protein [Ketobacteraceae bacterium]|nr:TIGR00266 family protein [Ketobacteraceae bacterium]
MSQFQVKLTGGFSAGTNEAVAAKSLSQLFNIDEAKAAEVISRAPVVIKKNVDESTAEKFRKALADAGIVCVVEAVSQPAPSADAPNTADNEHGAYTSGESVAVSDPATPGYHYKIQGKPDYAFLNVQIPTGKTLKVEASAMATMDANLVMKTRMRGGLGRLLTSESLFINEFTAEGDTAEIGIAPGSPGDIGHVYLQDEVIFLQNSAFVAADNDVAVESKWQGLVKGFFSGEALFLIRCSGTGDLWFNTYGAMIEIDVDGDYVVDTGNIVAFTDGLEYRITKVGGYKSLFFSGEGFVCRFSGKGKVWIQTRSTQAFAGWLYPFRPVNKKVESS